MSKIGIIGGTFDPIHNGHLNIAMASLNEYSLDKIIFIPAANPPHKNNFTSPEHRLKMVELAIKNYPSFEISDIELRRNGPSYTVDTLAYLHKLYPNDKLFFIIGADCIETLHTWHKIDEILKLCSFIVSKRPNHHIQDSIFENKYTKSHLLFLNQDELEISSTDIREKINNNLDTSKIMPKIVRDYIDKQKLYLYI